MKVTAELSEGFRDRMIGLVESSSRAKTPNEIALTVLLTGFTLIFMVAIGTLSAFAAYVGGSIAVPVIIALFVALIPTTLLAPLSAIGIAGMDHLIRFNVLAKSGRAVEAAGEREPTARSSRSSATGPKRAGADPVLMIPRRARYRADRA